MKHLMHGLILGLLIFTACSKEQSPPPKQEAITQQEQSKTSAMLVAEAKEKLTEAKAKLVEEGKYGCCIKEPCNMCMLAQGQCECYKALKKDEHVCTECFSGWQLGKGADDKIKKEDVKTSFIEHKH